MFPVFPSLNLPSICSFPLQIPSFNFLPQCCSYDGFGGCLHTVLCCVVVWTDVLETNDYQISKLKCRQVDHTKEYTQRSDSRSVSAKLLQSLQRPQSSQTPTHIVHNPRFPSAYRPGLRSRYSIPVRCVDCFELWGTSWSLGKRLL